MAKKKLHQCKKCKRWLPYTIKYFYWTKNKYGKKYLRSPCRDCKRKQNVTFNLKHRHGLTEDGYNKLLQKQNGVCAICGRTANSTKRKLDVDHNHKTKFIRGLLCRYCNSRLLKYFRDNKQIAMGLVNYFNNALEKDKDWK